MILGERLYISPSIWNKVKNKSIDKQRILIGEQLRLQNRKRGKQ